MVPSRMALQVSDPRSGTRGNVLDVSRMRFGVRRHIIAIEHAKMHQRPVVFEQRDGDYVQQRTGLPADQVEHRLRVAGRGRHRLQHIEGRRLMRDPLCVVIISCRQRDPQRGDFGSKIGDRSVASRGHVPPPAGSGRAVAVGQFTGRLCAARPFSKANDGWLGCPSDVSRGVSRRASATTPRTPVDTAGGTVGRGGGRTDRSRASAIGMD